MGARKRGRINGESLSPGHIGAVAGGASLLAQAGTLYTVQTQVKNLQSWIQKVETALSALETKEDTATKKIHTWINEFEKLKRQHQMTLDALETKQRATTNLLMRVLFRVGDEREVAECLFQQYRDPRNTTFQHLFVEIQTKRGPNFALKVLDLYNAIFLENAKSPQR
jgi:septal ring factor EnvC (AmiA/AmiB activator)